MMFDLDERLVSALEMLDCTTTSPNVLGYNDKVILVSTFNKLLKEGVDYNVEEIRNWLCYHQPENKLEDSVIDDIATISEILQIYLKYVNL